MQWMMPHHLAGVHAGVACRSVPRCQPVRPAWTTGMGATSVG